MSLEELLTLLNNKTNALIKRKNQAFEIGDIEEMDKLQVKIEETQAIIDKLMSLIQFYYFCFL